MMSGLSFDIFARDKASAAFDKVSKSVERAEKRFGFLSVRSHGLTAGMTAGFGKVAGAMAAVGAAGFLKGAITEASDLGETISKSAAVFGPAHTDILRFGKTAAKSLGQTQTQAIAAASQFGNMFNQLGIGQKPAAQMSKQMVTLASDFASFHNADITEVLQAQEAAFRGEFDSVQKFVPTINAAAVEQEGLRLGLAKSTKELDAQDKAVATQSLLMKGAGKAVGDFSRTSGGLANQQRILSAQFGDFKSSLGQVALPLVTKFVTFINERGIPVLNTIKNGVRALGAAFKEGDVTSDGFVGVMERIGVVTRNAFTIFKAEVLPRLKEFGGFLVAKVIPALGKTAQFISKNKDFFIPFAATIGSVVIGLKAWAVVQGVLNVVMAANPIGLLVIAIAALVAGIIYAYKHSEKFRSIVDTLGAALKRAFFGVVGFVKDTIRFFRELPRNIQDAVGNTAQLLLQKGRDFITGLMNGIWSIAKGIDSWMMRAPVAKIIAPWYNAGKWLIKHGRGLITGFISGVAAIARTIGGWMMRNVINPSVGVFTRAGSWLLQHGRNFVSGLINGVVGYMRAIGTIGRWVYNNVIVPAVRPFGQAGAWLARAGRDLIGGLVGGIATRMKGIGGWIKGNVVDPVVTAVKKFFGIKSPSTVFAGIGFNLVAGLMKGLAKTNGRQIATKVFGDMPSALRSMVGKGLVGLSGLPQKALDALGMGSGITLNPYDVAGVLAGPNKRVFYQGEALDAGTYGKLANAMKMVGGVNVTQGSYERASSYSGSTHTGGGVFDVVGGNLTRIMSGLKASGLIGWIRSPSQGPWPWHIHALDPSETGRMSASARAQVADYYRGGNGLAGYKQGTPWVPDDQWARLHKGEAVLPREVNEARIAASRNGGGSTVVLRVESGGSRMDDLIVELLRRYVRVNGGDVQAVLGR